MLIRIRSNVGVWRVEGLEASSTPADILNGIAALRPHVVYLKPLSTDPGCQNVLDSSKTLGALGLRHGSMVHCRVDPETCADVLASAASGGTDQPQAQESSMKRVIGKDGQIKLIPTSEITNVKDDKGFRPGMPALRDMKMQWTLNDFVAMDSQYEFVLKLQEQAICSGVSMEQSCTRVFTQYLQRFAFSRKRFGYLYGKFVSPTDEDDDSKKTKVMVEAIYEPPQRADPDAAEGFEMLDDDMEETVEKIAHLCGLQKVGWVFGHPTRESKGEDGIILDASEVMMAAELQLEAAGGIEETPFVTVKTFLNSDGQAEVEAFQVSQQCMEMVAEEAIQIGPVPGRLSVNDPFTVVAAGKQSKTVDCKSLLANVKIFGHKSEIFVSDFPFSNRDLDDRIPSHDELKRQLQKSGSQGWTFIDLLSDFNLLIYLSKFLDVDTDFPKICQSVVDRSVPLDDGYKIIITSLAGVSGAY